MVYKNPEFRKREIMAKKKNVDVDVENEVCEEDRKKFFYCDEARDFEPLIGVNVRGFDYEIIGQIVEIEVSIDGYGHENVFAILDNGRKFNCRTFNRSFPNFSGVEISHIDPDTVVKEEKKEYLHINETLERVNWYDPMRPHWNHKKAKPARKQDEILEIISI